MDVNIQKLILNLKEWQSFLGIIVSSIISIGVMLGSNKANERRWLNDKYLSRKNELEIEIRQKLLRIKELFEFWDTKLVLTGNETLISNIENDNLNQTDKDRIIDILFTCDYIKTKSQEYIEYEGKEQRTALIKDEYKLNLLIDEYMIFDNKIEDLLKEYKTLQANFAMYGEFIFRPGLDTSMKPGSKDYIEIFNLYRSNCLDLIKIAVGYKYKTLKLLSVIDSKIVIKV